MQHRYRLLMRKVRLYLLKEKRKKSWSARLISTKIFDERYWSWSRQSVATGAGWGAAAAIAPLPMQSFWGVAACLWRKGNIPVAVLMAWLSPPGFTFFSVPAQWWLGWCLFSVLGFTTSGADWDMLTAIVNEGNFAPLAGLSVWRVIVEFLTGWAVSCTVLGVAVYWLVQGLWLLFARRETPSVERK